MFLNITKPLLIHADTSTQDSHKWQNVMSRKLMRYALTSNFAASLPFENVQNGWHNTDIKVDGTQNNHNTCTASRKMQEMHETNDQHI